MKHRIIAAIMVMLVLFSCTIHAAQLDRIVLDSQNGQILIKGSVDPNEAVAINVLKQGISLEDLEHPTGSLTEYSIYMNTVVAGADGLYSVAITLPEELGIYTVVASTTKGKMTKTILLASPQQINDAVVLLNSASVSELPTLISQYQQMLTLEFAPYDLMVAAGKDLTAMYTSIANTNFTTTIQLQQIFRQSALASYVGYIGSQAEMETMIENYKTELFDTGSEIYQYYINSGFVKKGGRTETARVAFFNKKTGTYEQLLSVMSSSVAIAALNKSENFTQGNEVLTKFYTNLGISLTKYNLLGEKRELVYKELMKKAPFSTVNQVVTAFNDAVNTASIVVIDTGSNGNGGGGGGGGGGNNFTFDPAVPAVTPTPVPAKAFGDLGSVSWAELEIEALYRAGIVNGKAAGVFDPNGLVTREEFVKMLIGALGLTDQTAQVNFEDVASDQWYYQYVASAKKAGLVNGVSETVFGVGQQITRQDMSVMAAKALKLANATLPANTTAFADDADITAYAKTSIYELSGSGIIKGVGDNAFQPLGNATRAQAARVIYGILSYLKKI